MRYRPRAQHAHATDRFAREILAISAPSRAARSRRLMRNPLGGREAALSSRRSLVELPTMRERDWNTFVWPILTHQGDRNADRGHQLHHRVWNAVRRLSVTPLHHRVWNAVRRPSNRPQRDRKPYHHPNGRSRTARRAKVVHHTQTSVAVRRRGTLPRC
jgi:hypothetical protein